MAGVALANLPKTEHDELCCIYSALILHDEGMDVTADKINKLVDASGNNIEKYWPLLFANALKGKNVASLITNLSGSLPASSLETVGGSSAQPEAETKKEEKKEEKADDEDVLEGGLGFDEEW
ncbi:hypothetical protein SteCoe_17896 [Stentor coeruleus]|uniref:60S acidic ribosomal protein P1 n=1 Tax=Stentor coeruleus TaxID=5963 RepID=A0A1R2BXR4_9CILI|nr:hypothetical protein SteCoe_30482 [Stentor coeruleus]OMJ81588.1 hypothetical protein SteCoe_17896 [Stentor coeruleus]